MDYVEFKRQGIPFWEWPDEAKKTYSKILQAEHSERPLTPRERSDKAALRRVSRTMRAALLERYRSRCWYCGMPLAIDTLTIDHVIPIARVRTRQKRKIVPACRPCNSDKGDRTLAEYRALFPIQPKLFWGEVNGLQIKKKYG